MRISVYLRHCLILGACGLLMTGCEQLPFLQQDPDSTPHAARKRVTRAAAPAKPIGSPAAQKTCTETFRLEPGDARYDRCIASLTELETRP